MLLRLPHPIRLPAAFLSLALFLIFTSCFSVANAQEVKQKATPVKSNWQANLKRIYMFTDRNETENNAFDYNTEGKFSIRSLANDRIIFKGENINKYKEDMLLSNRSILIVDPAGQAKSKEQDSVVAIIPTIDSLKKDFSVFPNPISSSQTEITLNLDNFDDDQEVQVLLFDREGRVIKQQSFTPRVKQQAVTFPQLPSGMYFIKINEKDKQYSKTLLVR